MGYCFIRLYFTLGRIESFFIQPFGICNLLMSGEPSMISVGHDVEELKVGDHSGDVIGDLNLIIT